MEKNTTLLLNISYVMVQVKRNIITIKVIFQPCHL